MLQSAWLLIALIALSTTAVAVSTKSKGAAIWPNDDGVAIMSGVVGFISWGMVAFGAFDIRVVGDSVTYTFTMPYVAIFAVMMALIPGYIALTGPATIIRRSLDTTTEDL